MMNETQVMNPDLTSSRIYTDFQGLADLRRSVRQDSNEALHEVAAQFEAIFIKMMLKSMRDASLADGLFDSNQSEMYLDMFDNQIALDLSSKGVFGISEMLIKQLGNTTAKEETQTSVSPVNSDPVGMEKSENRSLTDKPFSSANDFVIKLMPEAQRAAARLGVEPELLVAQAALETGWGTRIIQTPSGESSHNLFGIKASENWQGEKVRVSTLEYRDGVMQKEKADFRSYSSFRESFDDYVEFVSGNKRYSSAINHNGSSENYIEALQEAGYATDPAYASKIMDIMQRTRS